MLATVLLLGQHLACRVNGLVGLRVILVQCLAVVPVVLVMHSGELARCDALLGAFFLGAWHLGDLSVRGSAQVQSLDLIGSAVLFKDSLVRNSRIVILLILKVEPKTGYLLTPHPSAGSWCSLSPAMPPWGERPPAPLPC